MSIFTRFNLCYIIVIDENELKSEAKISLAIWFYLNKKLSLAKLAKFSRIEFENLLSKMQIPISLLEIDDIKKVKISSIYSIYPKTYK